MSARPSAPRISFLRLALIAVLALDLLALATFAVRVDQVTRTTVVPAATARAHDPFTPTAPAVAAPVPLPPAAPIAVTRGPSDPRPSTTPGARTPVASPSTPTRPRTEEPGARVAHCPAPLPEPSTSGGLQTLIGYAPAFGPFRDEAFAAAAAYQPALQLLGPVLARYPQIAPALEPALAPFLTAFAGLLDQGYALISPLYSPYRAEVLDAEAKLAAALAPYAQELATSPLGGCVLAVQAALLEDTGD